MLLLFVSICKHLVHKLLLQCDSRKMTSSGVLLPVQQMLLEKCFNVREARLQSTKQRKNSCDNRERYQPVLNLKCCEHVVCGTVPVAVHQADHTSNKAQNRRETV